MERDGQCDNDELVLAVDRQTERVKEKSTFAKIQSKIQQERDTDIHLQTGRAGERDTKRERERA